MDRGRAGGEGAEKQDRSEKQDRNDSAFDDQIARDARAHTQQQGSVPETDISVDPDGVREDDARLQSVRDDWDGVPSVTETYRPSGSAEFRGDLYSGDDRDRVMHPSDGVGYKFNGSVTDVGKLRDRIESLPADIQAALKRGDDNVRITITASASRAGSEGRNQELSETRGQDMAKAIGTSASRAESR